MQEGYNQEQEASNAFLYFPKNDRDINKEWLKTLLKLKFPADPAEIKSFEIEKIIAGTENYTSSVLRVRIIYEKQKNEAEEWFIIKLTPDDETARTYLHGRRFFHREMELYNVIRKDFSKQDKMIEMKIGFPGPPCYFSKTEGTHGILVLEDLLHQGWSSFEGIKKKCNAEHCDAVVKKLAEFHVATYWMIRQKVISESNNAILFQKSLQKFPISLLQKILEVFLAVLHHNKKHPLLCESIEKFWHGNLNDEKITEMMKANSDILTVVHGDCWSNNMFCRYGIGNKPIDICFVDWQLSKISTPLTDLVYFFLTSTDDSVKFNLKPRLKFYYESAKALSENLELNYFSNVSIDTFYEQFRRQLRHGFGLTCLNIFLTCMGVHETVKSNEQMCSAFDQAKAKAITENPPGVKLILDIADIFVQWNVYDK